MKFLSGNVYVLQYFTNAGSTFRYNTIHNSHDPVLNDISYVNFNPRTYCLRSLRRRSGATATTTVSGSHSAVVTCQGIIPEIEILDSEDEEIQSALLDSMQHQEPSTISDDSTEPSVADILQEFWNRYIKDDRTHCVISCSKPLDIAILLLEKTTVKLQNKLFVKFSGQIGGDHSGPRREFFPIGLQGSKCFEGPDRAKVFRHDLQLVECHSRRTDQVFTA
ncbi:hypothetical protein DPMN_069005 [Dreissena polymorpha]|uniref:Uncharacterized protein n=1 Tax=Dreissena polymorpha TaxID=45954 RepID=A0A9D3Z272_DREPO|nr:hypothetical protein DPMN_069005 [Dreissena polymorpha]